MTTFLEGLQRRMAFAEKLTLVTACEVLRNSPKAALAGGIAYSYTRWYSLIPTPKLGTFGYGLLSRAHRLGAFANGANPLHAAAFATLAYLVYCAIRPTLQTLFKGEVSEKRNERSLEENRWNNLVVITNALAATAYISYKNGLTITTIQGIGLSLISGIGIWLFEQKY